MKLPKNITGFSYAKTTNLPAVSLKDFKRACYKCSRSVGFKINNIIGAIQARNFYECNISYKERNISIICNQIYPYVTLAIINGMSIDFTEDKYISDILKENNEYKVLDIKVLNKQVTEEDKEELEKSEIDQINYWKSKKIGEIIFNHYD